MSLVSVDLPEPDGPTMPMTSPARMESEMSFRTSGPPGR